ncbi:YcaO-like family protein [Mycobacterium angelicum]|nr:YcaO-like family protein [Mycobacterium angelicum]MCV7198048.1 YcaO-like family protein [Mycobacterium angelicum]
MPMSLRTAGLAGPDWSYWPRRFLGTVDQATIGSRITYRHGTHRIITPDETWHALQPLLDCAGITRVADLTWLDDLGIPTAQAVRPASLSLSVSQGKASTYRAAQVSAVMESLEMWHVENVTPDLWSTATDEIASDLTYDPAQLRLAPGALYHSSAKLDWMVATTLLTGRRTWVPWMAVLVNVAISDCWAAPIFMMDSSGLASGNSYDEATLHALYEIMERHSISTAVPGETMFEVARDDVAGSDSADLIEMIYRAGSEVLIARIDTWDRYFSFAVELTSPRLEPSFSGFGLHHDPNVALSRAITEAAQARLTAISGVREDIPPEIYHSFARPAASRASMRQLPAASPTSWHIPPNDSLPDLVASAATAVAAEAGVEPLAVVCDFDCGCVPVVKVFAPALSMSSAAPSMRTPLAGAA